MIQTGVLLYLISIQVISVSQQDVTIDSVAVKGKSVRLLRMSRCVCSCDRCGHVCESCGRQQWCAQWCTPLSSSAQDIISQSPGLMERDEWWGLHLPAAEGDDGVCARANVGQAVLCLAWPPHTWDHEPWPHSKPQLRPYCYKKNIDNKMWSLSFPLPWKMIMQKEKNADCILFLIMWLRNTVEQKFLYKSSLLSHLNYCTAQIKKVYVDNVDNSVSLTLIKAQVRQTKLCVVRRRREILVKTPHLCDAQKENNREKSTVKKGPGSPPKPADMLPSTLNAPGKC